MRTTLALVGATALAAAALSARAVAPADVYAAVSPSVWRVATYDQDGLPLSQGSGVVIDKDRVATNCHVLAKAKRVAVRRDKVSIDAKLVLWDPERDVCELAVPGLDAPSAALADTATIAVGQSVYAIGNPKGLDLTLSSGLISSVRRTDKGAIVLIQTSAAVSAGSSGGGLFDEQGRLVGLTTLGSVVADAQNLNFAIPADWIRDLPERHARRLQQAVESKATGVVTSGATVGSDPPPGPEPRANAGVVSTRPERFSARVDDLSLLPYASEEMRERYRVFLTRPSPRAFAISEGGAWRQAWDNPKRNRPEPFSASERALRDCEKTKTGRCFLYAIDDRVVYVREAEAIR